MRTAQHKYIQYRELKGMDELYDLERDPYEEANLIGRADSQPVLQSMRAELQRLIDQTQYPGTAATAPAVPAR